MHQPKSKILIDDASIERNGSRAGRGESGARVAALSSIGSSNIVSSSSAPNLRRNNSRLLANFTQTPSRYLTPFEHNRQASIDINGNGNTSQQKTIQQRFKLWIAPSNTPANVKIFGGKRAIQIEQSRSKAAGWVIHPYSSLRYFVIIYSVTFRRRIFFSFLIKRFLKIHAQKSSR